MSTKPRFLCVKIDIGLCLVRSRCARNHVFYVSKSTSACLWIEADFHEITFLIGSTSTAVCVWFEANANETTYLMGQTRHRLVNGHMPAQKTRVFTSKNRCRKQSTHFCTCFTIVFCPRTLTTLYFRIKRRFRASETAKKSVVIF